MALLGCEKGPLAYFGLLTLLESHDVIGPQFAERRRISRQGRSDVLAVQFLDSGDVLHVPARVTFLLTRICRSGILSQALRS